MSRIVVVGLRPHHVIVSKLSAQHMTDLWRDHSSGVLAISSTIGILVYQYLNWVYVGVRIFVEEAY